MLMLMLMLMLIWMLRRTIVVSEVDIPNVPATCAKFPGLCIRLTGATTRSLAQLCMWVLGVRYWVTMFISWQFMIGAV